jgi:rhodanese-related sulfurtransferase
METKSALKIGPETRMGEILAAYPHAKVGLFQKYHIGGCSACGYEMTQTLEDVRTLHKLTASMEEIAETARNSHAAEAVLHIDAAELHTRLAAGEPVRLVDARSPEEYAAGHLPGALLLNPELTFEILDEWPKDTQVVCYSNQGERSLGRASHFRAYGLIDVRSLDGGLAGWTGEVVGAADGASEVGGRRTADGG